MMPRHYNRNDRELSRLLPFATESWHLMRCALQTDQEVPAVASLWSILARQVGVNCDRRRPTPRPSR